LEDDNLCTANDLASQVPHLKANVNAQKVEHKQMKDTVNELTSQLEAKRRIELEENDTAQAKTIKGVDELNSALKPHMNHLGMILADAQEKTRTLLEYISKMEADRQQELARVRHNMRRYIEVNFATRQKRAAEILATAQANTLRILLPFQVTQPRRRVIEEVVIRERNRQHYR
jgi:hypothetical protein